MTPRHHKIFVNTTPFVPISDDDAQAALTCWRRLTIDTTEQHEKRPVQTRIWPN